MTQNDRYHTGLEIMMEADIALWTPQMNWMRWQFWFLVKAFLKTEHFIKLKRKDDVRKKKWYIIVTIIIKVKEEYIIPTPNCPDSSQGLWIKMCLGEIYFFTTCLVLFLNNVNDTHVADSLDSFYKFPVRNLPQSTEIFLTSQDKGGYITFLFCK